MSKRWKRRPEGGTWGDLGAGDQLGRMHLLNPETLQAAVQEVRTGLRPCLGTAQPRHLLAVGSRVSPLATV